MTRIRLTRTDRGPVRVEITPGLLQARTITRERARAHIALVAGGAVLVGGDHIGVEVRVGAGCTLDLEDVGGTVAYPSNGTRSRFDVWIQLEEGAVLVWRAHPFVVAGGAAVDRDTTVTLGAGSVLCLRETLVLGRTGEHGGQILNRFRARAVDGAPVHLEDLDLDGDDAAVGMLGAHRVLDSVLLLGRRPEEHPGPVVLHLEHPGAIGRSVADSTHRTGLDPLFAHWAGELLDPTD